MTCRKMGVTGNQMFSEISQESGQLPCIFLSSTEARFKIKYYICVCVCVFTSVFVGHKTKRGKGRYLMVGE